jgi:ATP-dependent RNA helicase DDX35
VGYSVRFEEKYEKYKTKILYLTDGMLLRECLIDPALLRFSIIIIDEAHERSINSDILL